MFLSTLGDDPCDTLRQFQQSGVDYIELPVTELTALDENAFVNLCRQLDEAPIHCESVNVLFPGTLRLIGEEVDNAAIKAHLDRAFERVARLGAEIVVFGSGKAKEIPKGFARERAEEQLLALLDTLGSYAARYRCTAALEALNTRECNFVTSVAEAYDFVRRANHPRVKLLVDYYHMTVNGEEEGILDTLGTDLCHIHFADPDGRTYPVPAKQRRYRDFFRHIKAIGYDGRLSMETSSKDRLGDTRKYQSVLRDIL